MPREHLPLHTKHLQPFAAVVAQGSLAGAARVLRRSATAVARALKETEAAVGAPLFERTAGGWLPTAAGQILHRRLERAFGELSAARDVLLAPPAGSVGRAAPPLRSAPLYRLAVHERRFELLLAFSERRPLGAAARMLGMSQPAASLALRALETAAGLPLFDRAPAGVCLNEAGQVLAAHVSRALAELRLALADIAATRGVIEGTLAVGALPFARPYLLPVAIGRLRAAHPALRLRTVEAPLPSLVASLRAGVLDLVVGALPPDVPGEGLEREELLREPLVVLARAGHPLARKARLTLRRTLEHPWVLPTRGTPTRDALEAALSRRGLSLPTVAVESADLSLIRGLLLESDMLSAASAPLFLHELRAGLLATLPIALPDTIRSVGILRRSGDYQSPGARRLVECLRAAAPRERSETTAAQRRAGQ